jgi:hypothetical protein
MFPGSLSVAGGRASSQCFGDDTFVGTAFAPTSSAARRISTGLELVGVRRPLRHETGSLTDLRPCSLVANDPIEAEGSSDVARVCAVDEAASVVDTSRRFCSALTLRQ